MSAFDPKRTSGRASICLAAHYFDIKRGLPRNQALGILKDPSTRRLAASFFAASRRRSCNFCLLKPMPESSSNRGVHQSIRWTFRGKQWMLKHSSFG